MGIEIVCLCGHLDIDHPLFMWKGHASHMCQKCLCKQYKYGEVIQ